MYILNEDTRQQLLTKSKRGDNYVPSNQALGKNRYQRRVHSKVANSVKEFNQMDMNEFFKNNILNVTVNVQGETDNYQVKIKFGNILTHIHEELQDNNNELNVRVVIRALITSFNDNDVFIHCSCPDWCLDENTEIKLLSGEVCNMKELLHKFIRGENLWVYSVDENGDFKPGKITDVWVSGYTKEFIKITLDNDKEILTTPNHRYMLRDGSYKEAQELVAGMSLMPLYFSYHNGYENIKLNSVTYPTKFLSTYKQVATNCLSSEIELAKNRSGENIISIHHKDFNKLNNNTDNLYPMGHQEHYMWHANHLKESGVLDKFIMAGQERNQRIKNRVSGEYEFQAEVMRKAMHDYYENISDEELQIIKEKRKVGLRKAYENGCFNTQKFHDAAVKRGENLHTPEMEQLIHKGILRYWDNLSEEEKEKRADITRSNQKKFVEKYKGVPLSEEHKYKLSLARLNESEEHLAHRTKQINLTKISKVINYLISNNIDVNVENYNLHRKLFVGALTIDKINKNFGSFENCMDELKLNNKYNHKVKLVEKIVFDSEMPVYDLTVDKYNNFCVDAGVILHNCYRFSYWSRVNNISADPDIEQTNNGMRIVNPNDTKGAGCKHVLLVLSNNTWLNKVAAVIYNYINYMKGHYERLYADIIYPAVYGEKFEEPVQLTIDDTDELDDGQETIDISNKEAANRGKFKPGNQSGIQFAPKEQSNRNNKQLNLDSLISDT